MAESSSNKIFVNGKWVNSHTKSVLKITNPSTTELIGEVPNCNEEDVNDAVSAAKNAHKSWWKLPGIEKAKLLKAISTEIRHRGSEIANLLTSETGKPLIESHDSIEWICSSFEYFAEIARNSYGNSIPPGAPHQINFTIKEPYGVIAAILPFNYPLLLTAWKIAPALAAGNTVIVKPPHQNPLSSLLMAKAYEVLPPGTVNVITGDSNVGEMLVKHPDVDMIAFTGSTKVGRRIASLAGEQLKKINLELGGLDPFIVFKDAKLDVAVPGVTFARLLNAGQVCTSSKRIYIEDAIYSEFTTKLVEYVKELRVGDPKDPTTDIGPLISSEQLELVDSQVKQSIEQGAKLLLGGSRCKPNGLPGHFYQPTILVDVPHGSLPTKEEIFGPVICITRATDADHAIEMANDSKYGLGASIYTDSLQTAMKAMESIKAGTFWVNDPLTDNDAGPFGGMRCSGMGRELGVEGLDAYREPKHVHIDYVMESKPYWFPYKNRQEELNKPH